MNPPPLPQWTAGKRPAAVQAAVWLGYSAILLGLPRILMEPPWHRVRLSALTAALGQRLVPVFWIGAFLYVFLVKGGLLYAAGLGKNWARITLLVIFVIGLPSVFSHLLRLDFATLFPAGLIVVQILCRIACICLLFSRTAGTWFRSGPTYPVKLPV